MPTGNSNSDLEKSPSGLALMLRALDHRNYRLFFSGQSISLIGTWMTQVTTIWLVYRLTKSEMLLGLVGFAGQIPAFILVPFAGVLVDRWNLRRLLIATQMLSMLQAITLGVLALTGIITIWHIIVLSLLLGVISAFEMPAQQAFVVEIVEKKEDVANAIALNSTIVNVARLLGPPLAGIIIVAVGEGWCFMLNGISYLAVIVSLLAMKIKPHIAKPGKKAKIFQQLREGWNYASDFPPIRKILLLLAIVSLSGMPYIVLMPVFANVILHGGPHTLGLLMAAAGVGALLGSIFLAVRKTVLGLGKFIPFMAGAFGAGLMALSFSRVLWLSLLLMVVVGLGFMIQVAVSNTILQTIVDEDKRGRVMSFYSMAFIGTTPFGNLLAGSVAAKIGVAQTLLLGGLGCILGALWFGNSFPALRRDIRRIYARLGILRKVATGRQNTSKITVTPKS